MKKCLLLCLAGLSCLSLISWNPVAKRTIAQIAENHLTPKAKARLKELFGGQSLADISTWADEAVNDSQYKNTALWHFVNVPAGITDLNKFGSFVGFQTNENIATALYRLYTD